MIVASIILCLLILVTEEVRIGIRDKTIADLHKLRQLESRYNQDTNGHKKTE